MGLNNKGFAISTILYGLSILILVLLMFMMKIMTTDNSNSKYYTETIKNELNLCSNEATNYKNCRSDCQNKFKSYVNCYCNYIYKDTSKCTQDNLSDFYNLSFPE